MSWEATGAAMLALAVGVALALVVDLASPKPVDVHAPKTAPSAAAGDSLSTKMEAQTNAGAPGVALALEQAASSEERSSPGVAAAHGHAQFLLGDAPGALRTVHDALVACETTNPCPPADHASLQRLDVVIGAVVDAGVVDPTKDPQRVDQALHGLLPGGSFAPH